MDPLLQKYTLVSDQVSKPELSIILEQLRGVLRTKPTGSVVEFGCYKGTTSLFLSRVLRAYPQVALHVYDSFEGLPTKGRQDESPLGLQFLPGELASSRSSFEKNYMKAGLALPKVHKGWFHEIKPSMVPDDIIFAFLDGDYYDSILQSLRLIWPKLTKEAVVVIDDYTNAALPGVARATDEFLSKKHFSLREKVSLAILRDIRDEERR